MWRLVYLFAFFAQLAWAGSFAHITDLHYDSQYKVASSSLGYCRSTEAGNSGRFGNQGNRCDSPLSLIKETLVWVATHKPKVDFVLVTGNFARRTRGEETRNSTDHLQEITAVSDLLSSLVAEPMAVLPAIGGSDLFPEGDCQLNDPQFAQFAKPEMWGGFLRPWLTSPESSQNFLSYGCYNATINNVGVVVLNTEFWSSSNGAVDASVCDEGRAGHQVFLWAEKVLEGYKQAGMKAIITGNRKYYDEYADNGYRPRCLARYVNMSVVYEQTIVGHLFGGSYEDSFGLIQNNVDFFKPNVTGVILVSPAVVPVKNPAVRVYEYATSGSTLPIGTLTDYVQYFADIIKANAIAELTFQEEYRATKAYELLDLSTSSWLSFFTKKESNTAMKQKYELYKGVSIDATTPPVVTPPDTILGVVFSVICGVLVLLAGALAWYKCRSFKYKTYEQELAEGLR